MRYWPVWQRRWVHPSSFRASTRTRHRGSIGEMRRAVGMMVLSKDRPYPKDLGIDLLVLKEKRGSGATLRLRTRLLPARQKRCRTRSSAIQKGNFRIGIEGDRIIAVDQWKSGAGQTLAGCVVYHPVAGRCYPSRSCRVLGRELYKAEVAIRYRRSFEQDGELAAGPNFYLPQGCTCIAWHHRHVHPISLSRLKTRQNRS